MKKFHLFLFAWALSGCGPTEFQDLKDFVKNSGEGLRGKVEKIPEVKPYEPFTYEAFDITDPFNPRKVEIAKKGGGGGVQPDMNRRKEALESYPLEGLQMVGVLKQNNVVYALIKAPDGGLFRVKQGNYIGQNFGKITAISEKEISIKEVVQDSSGDWTERTSSLMLAD